MRSTASCIFVLVRATGLRLGLLHDLFVECLRQIEEIFNFPAKAFVTAHASSVWVGSEPNTDDEDGQPQT